MEKIDLTDVYYNFIKQSQKNKKDKNDTKILNAQLQYKMDNNMLKFIMNSNQLNQNQQNEIVNIASKNSKYANGGTNQEMQLLVKEDANIKQKKLKQEANEQYTALKQQQNQMLLKNHLQSKPSLAGKLQTFFFK